MLGIGRVLGRCRGPRDWWRRQGVGGDGAGYALNGKIYADDLFADEAIQFVRTNREHPFFLYWAMVVPHANNERSRALGDGQEVPDYGPYADKDWTPQNKGQAAMITRMDRQIGELFTLLKKLKLDEKTIVGPMISPTDTSTSKMSCNRLENVNADSESPPSSTKLVNGLGCLV